MVTTHENATGIRETTSARPAEVLLAPEELRREYGRLRLADEDSLARMRRSLVLHGQQTPLVVREAHTGYELLDGFKRVRVCPEVPGLTRLLCQVVALDPREAKIAMVSLNRPSAGLTEMEEAWIVQALVREDGLSHSQVGAQLGKDKSWVSRRLALAERLVLPAQDAIRKGRLSPTAARSVALLPRGNQEELLTACCREGLSSREVGGVVRLLREETSPRIQSAILANPRGALKNQARREDTREARKRRTLPEQSSARLRKRMQLLERVGRTVGREIRTEIGEDPERLAVLAREGPRLSRRLRWLLECLPRSWEPSPPSPPAGSRSRTRSPTSSTPRDAPSGASPATSASPETPSSGC